jgi:hypothetical protein
MNDFAVSLAGPGTAKDPHKPPTGPRIPDFPAPQAAAIQPIRQDITQ